MAEKPGLPKKAWTGILADKASSETLSEFIKDKLKKQFVDYPRFNELVISAIQVAGTKVLFSFDCVEKQDDPIASINQFFQKLGYERQSSMKSIGDSTRITKDTYAHYKGEKGRGASDMMKQLKNCRMAVNRDELLQKLGIEVISSPVKD